MEKITRERRGAKDSEGQRRRDGDGGWTVLMAARGLAGRWLEAQMCLFGCVGVVCFLLHGPGASLRGVEGSGMPVT